MRGNGEGEGKGPLPFTKLILDLEFNFLSILAIHGKFEQQISFITPFIDYIYAIYRSILMPLSICAAVTIGAPNITRFNCIVHSSRIPFAPVLFHILITNASVGENRRGLDYRASHTPDQL